MVLSLSCVEKKARACSFYLDLSRRTRWRGIAFPSDFVHFVERRCLLLDTPEDPCTFKCCDMDSESYILTICRSTRCEGSSVGELLCEASVEPGERGQGPHACIHYLLDQPVSSFEVNVSRVSPNRFFDQVLVFIFFFQGSFWRPRAPYHSLAFATAYATRGATPLLAPLRRRPLRSSSPLWGKLPNAGCLLSLSRLVPGSSSLRWLSGVAI